MRRGRQLHMASAGVIIAGAALFATPMAVADPSGEGCVHGDDGAVFCDGPVQSNGSWLRCTQPAPSKLVIRGAEVDGPSLPRECKMVTPGSIPLNSPPYHIG